MVEKGTPLQPSKKLSFAKTRYEYSIKMYESEASRKQNLETKAQFYLTLYTAFVTAIFFSLPFLTVLQGFMHNPLISLFWKNAITVFIIALGIALIFSLIAVLNAMKIRDYIPEYPPELYRALFIPNPENFAEDDEADFLRFASQTPASAVDGNKKYNDVKARWVERASYGILASGFMLAFVVGISLYLQVYVVFPSVTKP